MRRERRGEASSWRWAAAWFHRALSARRSAVPEFVAIGRSVSLNGAERVVGGCGGCFESVPLAVTLGPALLEPCDFGVGVGEQWREPLRDRTPRRGGLSGCLFVPRLLGEGVPLGDGGDVGSVEGDDALEDVAGLGDVVAVGDDADHVVVAGPSGGDVQAAASRRLAR